MSKNSLYFSRRVFIKNTAIVAAGLAVSKNVLAYPDADHTYTSIKELSDLIQNKKVSPVEITKACLQRIERLNPKINAFITVMGKEALTDARIAEREIRNGRWKGPLHGIPISLKDNIDTAGIRTTAASAVYKDRVPPKDADLVTSLKLAGAILIGKTNLHEFALGTTLHISYYGAVRNPWNTEYIPGGSSGGSAAAVAAGMCYASIGTDTGGSIRLPAACCGLVGFKPTYSLISTKGIIPVVESVDHAGPICRSVQDAAILLNVLAGDKNNCNHDYRSFNNIREPRIGIEKNFKASDEIRLIFNSAVNVFHSLGCKTTAVELPAIAPSIVGDAEIEAYHQPLIKLSKSLYDPVTLNDIFLSKAGGSTDYIKGLKQMEDDRDTISERLFKNIDVLIIPTTAAATPTIEYAKEKGPFALEPTNTDHFNYYGLPAISIPCGFSENGMPVGLQIIGPRGGEQKVLNIANRYQQVTGFHLMYAKL